MALSKLWGAYGMCPRSRVRRIRAPCLLRFILLGTFNLPFEVYPAEKLPLVFRGRLPKFILLGRFTSPSGVYLAGKLHFAFAFRGLCCWEASPRLLFRGLSFWGASPRLPGFVLLGGFISPSEDYPAGKLHLAFGGLSCWKSSVALYLWFRF